MEENERDKLVEFLCRGANVKIIMALSQARKACSYSHIARISHVTLSHVAKMVKMLIDKGVLEISPIKVGREVRIRLSDKGKQIALKLNEMMLLIKNE